MSIFYGQTVDALKDFSTRPEQLGIVQRSAPDQAETFFSTLMQTPFTVAGVVHKDHAEQDISHLVEPSVPDILTYQKAYQNWINDMSEISKVFCDTQGTEAICFWLGTQRGCRRYHIDNVPMRMLVTYAGKGTEWIPDEAADREAFLEGAPNGQIVKDPDALQFMQNWDVAVFRGGQDGLLHRTPDDALDGPSILMRLDHPSFWDTALKHQFDQS